MSPLRTPAPEPAVEKVYVVNLDTAGHALTVLTVFARERGGAVPLLLDQIRTYVKAQPQ